MEKKHLIIQETILPSDLDVWRRKYLILEQTVLHLNLGCMGYNKLLI